MGNRIRALLTIVGSLLILCLMTRALIGQSAGAQGKQSNANASRLTRTVAVSTPMPTPIPTVSECERRVEELESKFDDLGKIVEVQSNVFDATVSRMESNLNLLLTIIGGASLLTAIIGFGVVRVWMRSLIEERLEQIASDEISRAVERELARIRQEWEPKFAELYKELRRVVDR